MRRISKFFALLVLSAIGITSCSLFTSGNNGTPNESKSTASAKEELTDFEFTFDEKLILKTTETSSYPYLELISGESYQIKTSIDDKLGDDYKLEYTLDDSSTGLTITPTGFVQTEEHLEKSVVASVYAKLYKKANNRLVKSRYVIITIRNENYEYAEATINDSSLAFDKATKTYTVNLNAGDSYTIPLNTKSNVNVLRTFALADKSYEDFMSVTTTGTVRTLTSITENKVGKVTITLRNNETRKLLDTIYLVVNITKSDTPTDKLEVRGTWDNQLIKENDVIDLYAYESMAFSIKYNNTSLTNALSTSSTNIEINGDTNTVKGLTPGEAIITVTVQDSTLTFKINVLANPLSLMAAINEGDDFVILNGELIMIGRMFVSYESGATKVVESLSELEYKITDLSTTHKSVEFSYTENNVTIRVTYQVRFFASELYEEVDTAYLFTDYGWSMYAQRHYLIGDGDLKFLVIPVWFNNSGNFFKTTQKAQIKEDIASKILEEKTDSNYWSVKSFYETESRGRLNISATISDFYETNTNTTSYTDTGDSSATYNLAKNAVTWYFENNTSDSISNYDADKDGKVDSVILFYAANYYGAKSDTMRSTAYAWADSTNSRNYNTGAFCPIGGLYGFNKNSDTSVQLEATDLSAVNPSSYIRSSRTVIHEVGHQFGAMDLYEYAATGETKNYPAGQFSMQDNDSGSHDPYHVNLFGWSKPDIYASKDYEVGEQITITVEDFQSTGDNIILTRDWNEYNSLFDEYVILELFTPTGLNEFDASRMRLNDVGFRVWHVNSILTNGSQDILATGTQQVKYSTYDRTSEFDLVHLIRNNENAEIDVQEGMKGSDLFKENSTFSFAKFSKQFVKGDRLDNEEKLGWEFKVERIFKKDNRYAGVVTLTRVDSSRTQFRASATMRNDIAQPSGNTNEIGQAIFDNENILMNYAFNSSSVYQSAKAIDDTGITLFGATDTNGGSIEISIKDKEGYDTYINSVKLVYYVMTNGVLKATANGNEIIPTKFQGPISDATDGNGNPVHNPGRIYEVNAKSVKLQNCFNGSSITHTSGLKIMSMEIEYTIIRK